MCGRLNVHTDPLARVFVLLTGQPFPGSTSVNVAPTEEVWAIIARQNSDNNSDEGRRTGEGHGNPPTLLDVPGLARPMRWWLVPYWSADAKPKYAMFNARSDSLHKSRAFRGSLERRRCLIPVAGFYEWIKEDQRKLPQLVSPAQGGALLLAGIWDRWRGPNQTIDSCAIITTQVNAELAFLHDRQPAMLSDVAALQWLDPGTDVASAQSLLRETLPVDLTVTPVSEYVNNARNKGDQCVAPMGNPRFIAASRVH